MNQWECSKNVSCHNERRHQNNKEATMVRNCQMAPKKPEANAPPSRAKDQNAILWSSNKKNRQHPPPTSRHWSVLTLHPVMSLFDIRSTTSSSIYGIIRSSREAIPIQKLKTITTNRLSLVEEDPRYVELLVSIYSPPEDQDEKKHRFQGCHASNLEPQDVSWGSQPVHKDE
jgi:hypothetical protein